MDGQCRIAVAHKCLRGDDVFVELGVFRHLLGSGNQNLKAISHVRAPLVKRVVVLGASKLIIGDHYFESSDRLGTLPRSCLRLRRLICRHCELTLLGFVLLFCLILIYRHL